MNVQFKRITEGSFPELYGILQDARQDDVTEAELFGTTLYDVIHGWELCGAPDGWIVSLGGTDVFAFGTAEHVPGVHQLWGFGTAKTPRVLPALTDYILNDFGPSLFKAGARRVQVFVPLSSQQSFHWLTEHLGMRVEALMPDYCTDGSPMAQLAYTRQDYAQYVSTSNADNESYEVASARD